MLKKHMKNRGDLIFQHHVVLDLLPLSRSEHLHVHVGNAEVSLSAALLLAKDRGG